ncbi:MULTISPECIES: hypothetical protein [unclassified Beijerinckia]|uniref:hypothetical protein n=1 Tax=unclassified Beijerinckia TaxID=2638183 RepID=UPI000894BC72|nr:MULTISPECIES: hypothetical protein [unclassified Beijerinckia]MDH7798495.1 hypothetical protein [Beijerinckia sp. GAS462]SED22804.1 hypothetical protein SAMN05443249_4794 [Beijerinckia sp. 28-YEA-48]
MADYYPLLARAVSGLSPEAKEQRRGIYERARKALLGQLRGITPAVPEEDIQRESQALDAAIARLEAEVEAKIGVEPPPEPKPEINAEVKPAAPAPAAPIPPAPTPPPVAPVVRPPPKPPVGAPTIGIPREGKSFGEGPSAAPSIDMAAPTLGGAAPAIEPDIGDAPRVPIKVRTPDLATRAEASGRDGNGAEGATRPEVMRPAAPRPQESSRGFGRVALIIGAIAVVFGGVGFAAWKWRDRPEDITRARSPVVDQQQPAAASGPKVNERIGSGAAPTRAPELQPEPQRRAQTPPTSQPTPAAPVPSQPASPTVQVAQRVGLLLQSESPQGFDTQIGTVVWRTDSINRGGNAPLSQAIRADFDVPDAKLKGFITIEKNSDPTLRASHTITVRFLPAEDSPLAKIVDIGLPVMRNESAANVEALAGVQAKITDNIFIVALTSDPQFAVRNIETIKSRGWLDIPMKLADGRAAKITLEKGNPGDRVVNEVFDAWGR